MTTVPHRSSSAPIALFAYNRPVHLRQVVEALRGNPGASKSDLIVYSDGPRNVAAESKVREVRSYVHTLRATGWFRSVRVVEREENYGLARSIIAGVTEVVKDRGTVIVLEDDLVPSPFFLEYMNGALEKYRDVERVISVHGYVYPTETPLPETFLLRGADCWGWGTWERGWDLFDSDGKRLLEQIHTRRLEKQFDFNGAFDYTLMLERQVRGEVDSWAIRWHAAAFLADRLTLYPGRSLIRNIGTDGSGTHEGKLDWTKGEYASSPIVLDDIPVEPSSAAQDAFERYFRSVLPGRVRRRLGRLKHGLERMIFRQTK